MSHSQTIPEVTEEWDTVTQTYTPGFSALRQPVLTLMDEGELRPGGDWPDGNILKGT